MRTTVLLQHTTGLIYLLDGAGRGSPISSSGPFTPHEAMVQLSLAGETQRDVLKPSHAPKAVYVGCEPISLEQLRIMAQMQDNPYMHAVRDVVTSSRDRS